MTSSALPTWDMSQYFPGLDSPEFSAAVADIRRRVSTFAADVEARLNGDVDDPVATFDALYCQLPPLMQQTRLCFAYVHSFTAVNTRDELANRIASELDLAMIPFRQASTRLTAWIGRQDSEALINGSDLAKHHAFQVRSAVISARHLMSQPEEDLLAELTLSGGSAFDTLQSDIASQIMVTFEKRPGETVTIPMSDVRNLANDPDRDVRRRAFEAEIAAWKQWQTPIAAALNGVKGEHVITARKRNWGKALNQSLFQNHIDEQTLNAMMDAAREAWPDIRRYWIAKARALGVDKLMWYDITAPVGENTRSWSWDEAIGFVKEQFATFSPRMAEMVQQAIDENWIDAGPREGKVGGAFCMGIAPGKSGVLTNFTSSFDAVSTIAHELGHAYHNVCQKDSSIIWRSNTPMTLAETASTFCETILRKAAIAQGTPDEKFAILEGALVDAGQIVVDISSRFLFESAVFEKRAEGQLSVEDFNTLMIQSQKETYGDAIAEDGLHPYMWAVKSHYYSPRFAFYNFPYMFGLLFGLGLYKTYEEDPTTFRATYDDLLASTGSADAATLAGRFGFDIRSVDFWRGSLDVIRQDVDEFCALVDQRAGK